MGMDEMWLEYQNLSPEMQDMIDNAKECKENYLELKSLNTKLLKEFDDLMNMSKSVMEQNKELREANNKALYLAETVAKLNDELLAKQNSNVQEEKKFEQATTPDGLPIWESKAINFGCTSDREKYEKEGWEPIGSIGCSMIYKRPVKKHDPVPYDFGR